MRLDYYSLESWKGLAEYGFNYDQIGCRYYNQNSSLDDTAFDFVVFPHSKETPSTSSSRPTCDDEGGGHVAEPARIFART